jgi:hypothetical protein
VKRVVIPVAAVLLGASGCSDDGGVKTVTVTDTGGSGAAKPSAQASDKAEARLIEQGFTQQDRTVAYGLVVSNPASSSEAQEVEVTVNGIDSKGNVAATDNKSLSVIPPRTNFNVGGALDVGTGDRVKELEIDVSTGNSAKPEHPLPKVSNVRLDKDPYGGFTIRGQVDNVLESKLSSIADVFAVVRDGKGEIIAGGFTFPTNDIPPGGRAAVSVSFFDNLPGATSADMSADNEIAP